MPFRLPSPQKRPPLCEIAASRMAHSSRRASPSRCRWQTQLSREFKVGRRRKNGGLTQGSQHVGVNEDDALLAPKKTSGVEFRVLADHEILRDMAAAIDDDLVEPRPAADLDIGEQHRPVGPGMRI